MECHPWTRRNGQASSLLPYPNIYFIGFLLFQLAETKSDEDCSNGSLLFPPVLLKEGLGKRSSYTSKSLFLTYLVLTKIIWSSPFPFTHEKHHVPFPRSMLLLSAMNRQSIPCIAIQREAVWSRVAAHILRSSEGTGMGALAHLPAHPSHSLWTACDHKGSTWCGVYVARGHALHLLTRSKKDIFKFREPEEYNGNARVHKGGSSEDLEDETVQS